MPLVICSTAIVLTINLYNSVIKQGSERQSYLNEQIQCHTLNIYHEARGEPVDGQRRVFDVVQVRAKKRRVEPCQAIYEPFQFSLTLKQKQVSDLKSFLAIRSNVEKWMKEPLLDNKSDHYHADNVSHKWAKNMKFAGKIGTHVFYASQ